MSSATARAGATAMLAEFVAGAGAFVSDAARRSLFDTRCAIVAGRATAGGRAVAATAEELGDGSPAMAAWLAGATASASHMDDVVAYGGAGAPVWAALLALAADLGDADDARIAAAGETGMLTALALWRAGRYQQPERGFDGTSVFGVLAAAAACARLLGLDRDGVQRALSVAASQSGGLVANSGTVAEAVHAGTAARDGVMSALLAASGLSGAPDIFEGRQGFGEAFFGLANSRLENIGAELDTPRSLDGELRSKWIPGHVDHQRPVRALVALLSGHGDRRVIGVVVDGVPPTSLGNRFSVPATPDQAARSLRYAVASAVHHRLVRLTDYGPEALASRALDGIEIRSSPRWDRRLEDPHADASHVAVEFDDGGAARACVDDFAHGASLQEVNDKWRRTADELGPSALTDELRGVLADEVDR